MSRSNHDSKRIGGREYWSRRYTPTVLSWGPYGKRLTHRFERKLAKLAIPYEVDSYQDEQADLIDSWSEEWYDDEWSDGIDEPLLWLDPSNQNQPLARLGDVLKSA